MKGRRPNTPKRGKVNPFPSRPLWLQDIAASEWNRVADIFTSIGGIEDIDQTALAAYCQTYAHWRAAVADINAHGLTLDSGKPNPSARQADALLKSLRGLLNELGFTPAARGRLEPAPDAPSKDDEELDRLIQKAG